MDQQGPSPSRTAGALALGLAFLLGAAFTHARPHPQPPDTDRDAWQSADGDEGTDVEGQCMACHRSGEGHPVPGIGPSLVWLKEAPFEDGLDGPNLWLVRGFTPAPARAQRAPLLTPEDLGYGPGSLIHLRY